MSFKALMISMQQDMIDVAKANKRVEAKQHQAVLDDDGIYMQTLPTDDDRHDSDAEEFRNESKREEFDAMADAGMSIRDFL